MFAVCVTFKIKTGQMTSFLPLMQANAEQSLQSEAHCHQFDVLTDTAKPHDVFLYELYTDRAGFEAHLESAHFKSFDRAVQKLIAHKTVQTWDTLAK